MIFREIKTEKTEPLRRHTHKLEDNVKLDTTAIALENMDWIYMAQDRTQARAFVNMIMHL
jgi:hypothetical protein